MNFKGSENKFYESLKNKLCLFAHFYYPICAPDKTSKLSEPLQTKHFFTLNLDVIPAYTEISCSKD